MEYKWCQAANDGKTIQYYSLISLRCLKELGQLRSYCILIQKWIVSITVSIEKQKLVFHVPGNSRYDAKWVDVILMGFHYNFCKWGAKSIFDTFMETPKDSGSNDIWLTHWNCQFRKLRRKPVNFYVKFNGFSA